MKLRIFLFSVLMMCSGITATTQAAVKVESKQQAEVRAEQLKQRLNEIRAMDLEHLNRTDRINLKHELKDMKQELKQMHPYIYISAGALILIIILLLLLL